MVQWNVDNQSCFLYFLSGSYRALFFSKVAGELPLGVLRRVYGGVLFDLHADHGGAKWASISRLGWAGFYAAHFRNDTPV